MSFDKKQQQNKMAAEKTKEKKLLEEMVQVLTVCSSEPINADYESALRYVKGKIDYFRRQGLEENFLYILEARPAIYMTQYIRDHLIEWDEFLKHDLGSFCIALKELIRENKCERAKQLAETLITYYSTIDEEHFQKGIAAPDVLGRIIYQRVSGLDAQKGKVFISNDYAELWILYAQSMKTPSKDAKGQLIWNDVEPYLHKAIQLNPYRADAWMELLLVYDIHVKPEKYEHALKQAFQYAYTPGGPYGLAAIYQQMAFMILLQKGSVTVVKALRMAVKKYAKDTRFIDYLMVKRYGDKVNESPVENFEEILEEQGIQIGFSDLVKAAAREVSELPDSDQWKGLWIPVVLDELEHGTQRQMQSRSREEKKKLQSAADKCWTHAFKIVLSSYLKTRNQMLSYRMSGGIQGLDMPENVKLELFGFFGRYHLMDKTDFEDKYKACCESAAHKTSDAIFILPFYLIMISAICMNKFQSPLFMVAGVVGTGLVLLFACIKARKKFRAKKIWKNRKLEFGGVVAALEQMCLEFSK